MSNPILMASTAVRQVNEKLELRDMLANDKISNEYKNEILQSYKKMKRQHTRLILAVSLVLGVFAIALGFMVSDPMAAMGLIFGITILAVVAIIIIVKYTMSHAGKEYSQARSLYRAGMLGMTQEEIKLRTGIDEDISSCLKYFKRVCFVWYMLMAISLPIAAMIGFELSKLMDSGVPLIVILVVDIFGFMYIIDSPQVEVRRLSKGYYTVPMSKVCTACGSETEFLVHSSDSLICHNCGNGIQLDSWEKKSHKVHKKIKWLIEKKRGL